MTARRTLHASAWERAAATVAVIALSGSALADLLGPDAVWTLRMALLVVGLAVVGLWCVQAWRWRIVADEDGLLLETGLGGSRRVGWDEVEGVRVEPSAAVRLQDDEAIPLDGVSGPLLPRPKLRELDEVVRGTRP